MIIPLNYRGTSKIVLNGISSNHVSDWVGLIKGFHRIKAQKRKLVKRVHWQNHHLNHLNFSHWQIDQKTKTREFSSIASHCMMMGAQPYIHLKRPLQCKPWKLEGYITITILL